MSGMLGVPRALFAAVTFGLAMLSYAQQRPTSPSATTPEHTQKHSVALHWSPPSGSPVEQFIVYRADGKRNANGTPHCSKKFKEVARVDKGASSFTDWNVKARGTYCYKVTSLVANVQSPATETVVAVVPPDGPKGRN